MDLVRERVGGMVQNNRDNASDFAGMCTVECSVVFTMDTVNLVL